jgi:hypothetical protein
MSLGRSQEAKMVVGIISHVIIITPRHFFWIDSKLSFDLDRKYIVYLLIF